MKKIKNLKGLICIIVIATFLLTNLTAYGSLIAPDDNSTSHLQNSYDDSDRSIEAMESVNEKRIIVKYKDIKKSKGCN